MQTTAIVLCNGMDDSLLGLDLPPFEYGTVSPYDMKPIKKKKFSFNYNTASGPDGRVCVENKELITVETLYDFFHHLFAPLSVKRTLYCEYTVKKKDDGTCCSEYQQFRYFKMDTDRNWEEEEKFLIDAIRLFKTSRAGFGIGILPEDGLGINDLYPCETKNDLWDFLPIFTLSDSEKEEFRSFYMMFRDWYYKENPGSKDQLTRAMLGLFRLAYRNSDAETALLVLSEVWELFAQQFPARKAKDGSWVSERIRQTVSRMIRNGGVVKGSVQDNLYQKVGYLYRQRSIIVHQDNDKVFDRSCVMMAFDITRCLILKLIYAEDENIEDVVRKVDRCKYHSAPYKVDSVRYTPVDEDLMKRIFSKST